MALGDGRDGGGIEKVGGGRRGGKVVGGEHGLHGAPTYPSMGSDTHPLSPVHALEAGRGKEGVSNR